jgi:hypothetical protein
MSEYFVPTLGDERKGRSILKVQIVAFDGFDELDAAASFEVLKASTEVGVEMRVESRLYKMGTAVATLCRGVHAGASGGPHRRSAGDYTPRSG